MQSVFLTIGIIFFKALYYFETSLFKSGLILFLFRLRVDGVPPVSIQLKEIAFALKQH